MSGTRLCRLGMVALHEGAFAGPPSDTVDPQVRRRPDEICPRIVEIEVDLPEQAEDPYEGILDEVLAIPHTARQPAAVAMQVGSKGRKRIQIARPRRTNFRLSGERGIGLRHGPSSLQCH